MTIDEAVQFIKGCKRIAFWALSKPEQDRVFSNYCKAWDVVNGTVVQKTKAGAQNMPQKGSVSDSFASYHKGWGELEAQQDNHLPIPMRCV